MKKKKNGSATSPAKSGIDLLIKEMNEAAQRSHQAAERVKEQTSEKLNEIRETGFNAFDSVSSMMQNHDMNAKMLSPFRMAYQKNIDLAQNVVSAMVNAQNDSMNLSARFVSGFLGAIGQETFSATPDAGRLFELLNEYLQKSTGQSSESMMKMLEACQSYLNYSMKFNRNFANVVITEMINLMKIQNRNRGVFSAGNMTADWWNK